MLGSNSGKTGVGCAGNNHSQGGAEKHRRGVCTAVITPKVLRVYGRQGQGRATVNAVVALSRGHLWCLSILMFVSMTRCVRSTHVLSFDLVFCCFTSHQFKGWAI